MIKEQFFPTILYAKDIKLDNSFLEKEIIKWSEEDKGITKSNVNGWHSHTNMHEMPVFKILVDELFKMQSEIFNEENLNGEPCLISMWANINLPGGYNKSHIHPNSHFSGVYYIKATKDSGDIVFNDPKSTSHMIVPSVKNIELPKYLWKEVRVSPVVGRIIIFPSWLWHRVDINNTNDKRISVSFNFTQRMVDE
tara:strand:+ start:44 stop:628 length:585 start_codon:yes stop_codon:yes gene_type:complete